MHGAGRRLRPKRRTAVEHYDSLETRHPEVREAELMSALPRVLAAAKAKAPGFARILEGIDPEAMRQ